MTRPDTLHTLILKMDVNEKRYFKLNGALQKKDSNMMRLFDFMSKMKEYDEASIRENFAGEKFLEQLAVTKNHVFNAILRSMRSYNIKRDIDLQLQGSLQDVRFLFEKDMLEHCLNELRAAKKLAVDNERYLIRLTILDWEARLLSDSRYAEADEADIDRISEEYYEVLGLLQNQREYLDLQSKIFNNYYKIGLKRKNTDYKTNDQIVNQFALKDESRAQTFVAKCCYLNIHALYRKMNNDWEGAYSFRIRLLELMEAHFDECGYIVGPERLFAAINNLIPICVRLGRYDEADAYLKKQRSLFNLYRYHTETVESQIHFEMNALVAELAISVRIGDRKRGEKSVRASLVLLDSFSEEHKSFGRMHLMFNMAYFYFADRQFNKAIRWINNVLNDKKISSNEDLHATCRILAMMTHFELSKGDLLDYLARGTAKYLRKLEGIYAFEEAIMQFMRGYAKSRDFDEITELASLREKLLSLPYEPGERNALSVIDIPRWIDARLSKRPMLDIASITFDQQDPDRSVG